MYTYTYIIYTSYIKYTYRYKCILHTHWYKSVACDSKGCPWFIPSKCGSEWWSGKGWWSNDGNPEKNVPFRDFSLGNRARFAIKFEDSFGNLHCLGGQFLNFHTNFTGISMPFEDSFGNLPKVMAQRDRLVSANEDSQLNVSQPVFLNLRCRKPKDSYSNTCFWGKWANTEWKTS